MESWSKFMSESAPVGVGVRSTESASKGSGGQQEVVACVGCLDGILYHGDDVGVPGVAAR